LLTSPDFKAFLSAEALREGISVAELVRTRCERRPTDEEAILAALTVELNEAVAEARRSLKCGLDEAKSVLAEIRSKRAVVTTTASPAARRRKAAGARA
jgi:hypothetical protein